MTILQRASVLLLSLVALRLPIANAENSLIDIHSGFQC